MRLRRRRPRGKRLLVLALLSSLLAGASEAGAEPLQLEVFVNGAPTRLIGSFVLLPGRRIAASRAELEEIGLEPPAHGGPGDLLAFDRIPTLTYAYDEARQRLSISVADRYRAPKSYSASRNPQRAPPARADYGAVLNYDVFAAGSDGLRSGFFGEVGASATLDGRLSTPFGTFGQTGILRSLTGADPGLLRLDSTFTYSDPDRLLTYRAGDSISGSLAWTRALRVGGFQLQRNFALRPDLVTLALPALRGSAAVPSTVDVYVNGLRTFSQDVEAGPYRISDLPLTTGGGTARVVLRDAAGRQVETSLPFYASTSLLAEGLTDMSFEAGFPRLSYGTASDAYGPKPVASGSLRRGLGDWITVEAHGETGMGLANGGVGGALRAGRFGVLTAAVSASRHEGRSGQQAYAGYETTFLGVTLQGALQRSFGRYEDLASVTAQAQLAPLAPGAFVPNGGALSTWTTSRPVKALDRVTLGIPLPFHDSSLGAGYIHLVDGDGRRSDILTGSWSRRLWAGASLNGTVFSDFGDRRNTGFLAGLSLLVGGTTVSAGVSGDRSGSDVYFDAAKPLGAEPGSYGWRVRDDEGHAPYRSGAVSYRSGFGRIEAGVSQDAGGARATAEFEGSVVAAGGGVFLANRIDDAFAVVRTGVPGVPVYLENRPAAVTDATGRALLPGLNSYQRNKVSIDTGKFPVDAEVDTTQETAVPAWRSGLTLDFGVRARGASAVVVLVDAAGTPLPAGAQGRLEATGEGFVVGYEGRAYVKGLSRANAVVVTLPDGECRASFAYSPRRGEQVEIAPVPCRRLR